MRVLNETAVVSRWSLTALDVRNGLDRPSHQLSPSELGAGTTASLGKRRLRLAGMGFAALAIFATDLRAAPFKGKQLETLSVVDGRTRDKTIAAIVGCLEDLNRQAKKASPVAENKAAAGNPICGEETRPITFRTLNRRPELDQRALLVSLAKLLNRPEARLLSLRIVGHARCDEVSDWDRYGLHLSVRRAKTVANLLASAGGVNRNRLVAEGRGYFEPVEIEGPHGNAAPKPDSCALGTKEPENARVEFVIETPMGLAYGADAGQNVSALGGADPLPRANQPPKSWHGGSRALRSVLSSGSLRYFPMGLRPGAIYTLNLSRVAKAFLIDPRRVKGSTCAGYRTAWQTLPEISELDRGTGNIALRLRTVWVRSEDAPHNRDRVELLLDVDGRAGLRWGQGQAAFPGHWTYRERAVLALRHAFTGSPYRASMPSTPLTFQDGWGMADKPADYIAPCGFPGTAENASTTNWANSQPVYDQIVAALPATPEDLVARRLEVHPLRGFARVWPGFQLCVASAGTAIGSPSAGGTEFRLGFAPPACTTMQEFTFASGRTGLSADGGNWRYTGGLNSFLPSLPKQDETDNPHRVLVTRWSDLVDPSQASQVYIFSAKKFLWANQDQWIGSEENADYVIGVRNPQPPMHFELGLFFADRFVRNIDEACHAPGGEFTAATLPGSYQHLRADDLGPGNPPKDLLQTAKEAPTRCATAERFSEITLNLPVKLNGAAAFVPIGLTWGELASRHRADDKSLFKAAKASAGAAAIFGDRVKSAILTQGAVRTLPLLPGDTVEW